MNYMISNVPSTAKVVADFLAKREIDSTHMTYDMEENRSNRCVTYSSVSKENKDLSLQEFQTEKIDSLATFKTVMNVGEKETDFFVTGAEPGSKTSRNKYSTKNKPNKNWHDTCKKIACNLDKIGRTCSIAGETISRILDVWK